MRNIRPLRRGHRGFTLIELMVTVLIVGVLAAIAYASYTDSVVNSRRAAASACLTEVSQFMERYYTTNLTYVGAAMPDLGCRTDLANFYTFSINGTPTATAYAVQAAPVGQQSSRDGAKCGTLGLNQAGARSASGSQGVAGCW